MRRGVRLFLNVTVATGLLLSGLVVGTLFNGAKEGPLVQLVPAQAAVGDALHAGLDSGPVSYSQVIKQVTPAVVSVASSKVVKVDDSAGFPDNPMFRQFFGNQFPGFQMPREHREDGLGSGVVVDGQGFILTNNHVVDGADEVKVILADKREFTAKIIGRDAKTDLALLKIEAQGLPSLQLADTSSLEVGDIVFAIGNPFGVGQTVTMGIVSATGRGNLGIEDYEDFIQTDAAINPGNSGGALINARGQLVGINTAIIGRSGGNDGIGFAIPTNMAVPVVNQLRNQGRVTRGMLGAVIQNVTPELAKALGTSESEGALVGDLTPDGPAAKAGLKRGDVITALNGEPVADSRKLRLKIAGMAPGTNVQVSVVREGQTSVFPVTLGELPDKENLGAAPADDERGGHLGIGIQDLTPEIRQSLNLPKDAQGVVVAEVESGSPAERAGVRQGDVIEEVNRVRVHSAQEFADALHNASKESVLLLVNREGMTAFVVVSAR